MTHYGEEEYLGKESQLYTILEGYGEGAVWSEYPVDVPKEAMDFAVEQFQKYKVPIHPGTEGILVYGTALFLDYVNAVDPYTMFFEFSDVSLTNDWRDFTYELISHNGGVEEADPTELDTFSYIKGQSESFFNYYINKPGFNQLPQFLCASVMDVHEDVVADNFEVQMYNWYNRDGEIDLQEVINTLKGYCQLPNGEVNIAWINAYFDITLWVGALWLFGPLSREFRTEYNPVTSIALEHGEVIIYRGCVYDPTQYKKIPRTSRSCYKCGVSAWCIENTIDDDGVVRFICEGCVNQGAPVYGGATCGSRFCKYWECPHNVYHHDTSARMGAMRQHGQLGKKAQAYKDERSTIAMSEKQLAIGG